MLLERALELLEAVWLQLFLEVSLGRALQQSAGKNCWNCRDCWR